MWIPGIDSANDPLLQGKLSYVDTRSRTISLRLDSFSTRRPNRNRTISFAAFISEFSKVETKAVRERTVGQLANVDTTIAECVATGLGLQSKVKPVATTVPARQDLPNSPALSILAKAKNTLQGRVVGCLVADGSNAEFVLALKKAAMKLGADFKVIASKIGGAIAPNGKLIEADFQLAGGSSVLFDTVYVAISNDGAKLFSKEAAAVAWVHDAFAHLKVIGASAEAAELFDAAGAFRIRA